MSIQRATWRVGIAAGALVLLAVACSGDEAPTSTPAVATPTAAPEATTPPVDDAGEPTTVSEPTEVSKPTAPPSGPTDTAGPTSPTATAAPTPTPAATPAGPRPSPTPFPDTAEATATAAPAATPRPTLPPEEKLEASRNSLMWDSLESEPMFQPDHFVSMGASGDRSYIPVLIEWYFTPTYFHPAGIEAILEALRSLTGEEYTSRDWREWIIWLGEHDEVTPPTEYVEFKKELYGRIDPGMAALLGEAGQDARIRVEEVVWGGVRKDGIPDLRYPPTIPADDPGAEYLSPGDRVFGVSINGEHRAYPLRIVNAHEMVNDTLGGEPFALAY